MAFNPRALTVIEHGTIIDGDLDCYALRLLGRVNGNVTVKSFVDIEKDAVITGELKAGSVRVALGARIGKFSLLNSQDVKNSK